jgi:hypothetical protein
MTLGVQRITSREPTIPARPKPVLMILLGEDAGQGRNRVPKSAARLDAKPTGRTPRLPEWVGRSLAFGPHGAHCSACVQQRRLAGSPRWNPLGMERSPKGDCEVAQARELIRALRDRLGEMTTQLAWVERQDVARSNGRAGALRLQEGRLRRDIREAQGHIDRLQLRYLSTQHRRRRHA